MSAQGPCGICGGAGERFDREDGAFDYACSGAHAAEQLVRRKAVAMLGTSEDPRPGEPSVSPSVHVPRDFAYAVEIEPLCFSLTAAVECEECGAPMLYADTTGPAVCSYACRADATPEARERRKRRAVAMLGTSEVDDRSRFGWP
jgi:hypothetical protein